MPCIIYSISYENIKLLLIYTSQSLWIQVSPLSGDQLQQFPGHGAVNVDHQAGMGWVGVGPYLLSGWGGGRRLRRDTIAHSLVRPSMSLVSGGNELWNSVHTAMLYMYIGITCIPSSCGYAGRSRGCVSRLSIFRCVFPGSFFISSLVTLLGPTGLQLG